MMVFHEGGHVFMAKRYKVFKKLYFSFPSMITLIDINESTLSQVIKINVVGIVAGFPFLLFTNSTAFWIVLYFVACISDFQNLFIAVFLIVFKKYPTDVKIKKLRKKYKSKAFQ